jgi:outer membrane protein assembly complex protein YaeT
VRSAVSRLRDLYRERGYLEAKIAEPGIAFSPDRKEASLSLTIEEGARYVVESVHFNGEVLEQALEALKRAAREITGSPYSPGVETQLRSLILEIYGNLGYPAAIVAVRRETAENPALVVLAADIVSGPRVVISAIEISGNVKTREGYILSLLTFKAGDFYRRDRERESFTTLYGTGLYSKVSVELGGEPTADSRLALVRVQEAASREVMIEGGWGSYEQLRGRFGYRQKNLFGRGREAGAELGASLKGEDVRLSLTDPRFLRTPISASLPLTYRRREEPSFTRRELALSTVFAADLGIRSSGTLEYRYTFTDLSGLAPGFAVENLDTAYNLSAVKVQVSRDTRDDIFFPGSGHRLSVAAEVTDPLLGGDLAFVHLSAGARFFHTLFRRTVVGLRFDSGLILPMRDQISIPLGERLFNGGESTVRSFREGTLGPRLETGEPAGGLASNVMSLEVRRRFGGSLAGTVFFDYGNVAPNRTRQEQGLEPFESRSEILSATLRDQFRGFRPAVGVGLEYLLPIGPVRLDLAFNPDANEDRGESRSMLHFSVGAAF